MEVLRGFLNSTTMANITYLDNRRQVFTYDVSGGDSGTAGTKVLGRLPANAVITQAWIHVLTTFTSATDAATIALGYTGTVGAFDAAIAISNGGNPWDDAAPRVSDVAADAAVGNFVEIGTSEVEVLATVATETLTTGKLLLVVDYYIAD